MTTKQMLEQEIRNTIEAVHELEVGSKQHTDAVDTLTQMLEKYNQMDRLDDEIQEKYDSKQAEVTLKEKQLKQEKLGGIIGHVLTGVQIVACGILIPIWGVKAAAEYEKEGVFKNVWTKNTITDILPKRKK